ncbi:hypothetical protein RB595_010273 [Gaeumannomyces hyphopodioides]
MMEAACLLGRALAAGFWLLLLKARTAEAHDRGGGGGSSTGPAWAATTRAVMVGANGRVFSPNRTVAGVGDVVEFSFYPGNHSVVRSAYMFPCVPFETTGAGKTGFWSGFFDDKSQTPGRWRLTITDTTPIFFYSSGPDDCNRYGMVGGINVDPGELQMQHDMAVDSPAVVQPTVASSPNGGPSSSGSSPEPLPPSPSSGVPPGAIAGIAVGVFAALALLGFIFYACGRRRGDYDQHRRMLFPLGRMGGGGGGDGRRTPSPLPSPNKESQYHRGSSSHHRHNCDGSSNHHQHHHHDERTSSMTFLPTRGGTISGTHGGSSGREGGSGSGSGGRDGGGTTASRAGTRSSVVSSTNTASPFVASAATAGGGPPSANSNMAAQQHQQSPPPTALVAAGAPIVDGDTIYVPVKRSAIVSGEFGGGAGSGSCCSAASPPASPLSAVMPLPLAVPSTAFSPGHHHHHHPHRHHHHHHHDLYPSASPGPSPVPTAAQLHHRRWMASQADNSDAESGVFGFGMSRLATPRPPPRTAAAAAADGSPPQQHVLLAGANEAARSCAAPPPLFPPPPSATADGAPAPKAQVGEGTAATAAAGGGGGGVAAASKATAELGSMLNGTAPSLFPYNNDRCVLESRGALAPSFPAGGGGGGGGREPSELSG